MQRRKLWYTLTWYIKVSVGQKGWVVKKGGQKGLRDKFTNIPPFLTKTAIFYRAAGQKGRSKRAHVKITNKRPFLTDLAIYYRRYWIRIVAYFSKKMTLCPPFYTQKTFSPLTFIAPGNNMSSLSNHIMIGLRRVVPIKFHHSIIAKMSNLVSLSGVSDISREGSISNSDQPELSSDTNGHIISPQNSGRQVKSYMLGQK